MNSSRLPVVLKFIVAFVTIVFNFKQFSCHNKYIGCFSKYKIACTCIDTTEVSKIIAIRSKFFKDTDKLQKFLL